MLIGPPSISSYTAPDTMGWAEPVAISAPFTFDILVLPYGCKGCRGLAKQHFMAVRQMEEAGTSEPLRRAAAAYRDAYVAAHDAQGVAGPAAQQRADALRAQLQQFSILSSDDAFRCGCKKMHRNACKIVELTLTWQNR